MFSRRNSLQFLWMFCHSDEWIILTVQHWLFRSSSFARVALEGAQHSVCKHSPPSFSCTVSDLDTAADVRWTDSEVVVKVILFVSLWAALLNTVLVMLLLQHDCTLPLLSLYSSHPTIRVGRDLSCRLRFAAHSVMAFLSSTITSFSFLLPYVTASSPLCSSTVPSRPFAFITAKSSVFLSFL